MSKGSKVEEAEVTAEIKPEGRLKSWYKKHQTMVKISIGAVIGAGGTIILALIASNADESTPEKIEEVAPVEITDQDVDSEE